MKPQGQVERRTWGRSKPKAPDHVPPAGLSDEQRTAFLAVVEAEPLIGNARALRRVGVQGSAGQLRQLVESDEDLAEASRLARGWNIREVEDSAWGVAKNPDHPSWDRANTRILKAYQPLFRDRVDVDLQGSGPVDPLGVFEMSVEERLVLRRALLSEHPELVELVMSRRVELGAGDGDPADAEASRDS